MTEKEKLTTAKLYVSKLANGMDPVSGEELSFDSSMNCSEISDCMGYVFDLLQRYEANGCEFRRVAKQYLPFSITTEQKSKVSISEKPIGAALINENIKAVLSSSIKGVNAIQIGVWLEEEGYLKKDIFNGQRIRTETPKGHDLGIRTEKKLRADGTWYKKNIYNSNAQSFIVDNIDKIAEVSMDS